MSNRSALIGPVPKSSVSQSRRGSRERRGSSASTLTIDDGSVTSHVPGIEEAIEKARQSIKQIFGGRRNRRSDCSNEVQPGSIVGKARHSDVGHLAPYSDR